MTVFNGHPSPNQEAKARRQNKIKSKKYHRLLKRQKMKEHMKEFEALQRSDPDAALEKLRELEKQRVEERMTLKHKGAGKWAKMQAIRAKYDDSVSISPYFLVFFAILFPAHSVGRVVRCSISKG